MSVYNLPRLEQVALGLDNLLNRVIFIGGTVLELYATDASAHEIRPTREIDCLLNIQTASEFQEWGRALETQGFRRIKVADEERHVQHWRYDDIRLTFSYPDIGVPSTFNRWYNDGIFHAVSHILPSGRIIRIFTPPYVIATKIEAFLHRGRYDFRLSEDFEDIVYLLDNRPEIKDEVFMAYYEVRNYIRSHFEYFLGSGDLEEGLAYVLPFGSGIGRIRKIIRFMEEFSRFEPSLI